MIRVILAVILAALLTACGAGGPNHALVEKAIALQLSQTQEELGQLLYPNASQLPQFAVNRVNVTHQESLAIENLKAYRVQGNYDVTLDFGDRKITQHQNPFDLYLQRQTEDKSWRLARPQRGNEDTGQWVTKAIETNR